MEREDVRDEARDSPHWHVEHEFVQRLARRLLRDTHEAEDLAQDVWLTWLHRPPPSGSMSRRWIAGVVRNLAVDLHRRRGRRGRAESASTRPESPPPPQAQVAREALRMELAEAVRTLREPYGEIVRLHFYEDLDARQIARLVGVPLETVRTRLKRALAQLADELDRRSKGDRRRWLEALVLLLPGESAPVGAGRARGSRIVRVSAAAAVVLTASVLVWRYPLRAEVTHEASHVDGAPRVSLARSDEPGAPARETLAMDSVAAVVAPASAASSLTSRVVDGSGAPVAGARVGAWFAAAPQRLESVLSVPERETRSDAAGCFTFESLPLRFFVYAETDTDVGQEVLVAELDAPRTLAGLELRVGPARTIEGQVVDDHGRAVAGAEVALQGSGGPTSKRASHVPGVRYVDQLAARTRSASDGAFRMTGLTDPLSMLHVCKEGFVSLEHEVSAGDQSLELGLERGATLALRLLDGTTPIAGATVEALADRIEDGRGTTDANGRVELGPFGAPGELVLRITPPGRPPFVRGWFSASETASELVVDVPAARPLSARVLDASGRPVGGARVVALGRLADATEAAYAIRRRAARQVARLAEAISDEEGRATFAGLPEGALGLEVLDPEHGTPLVWAEVDARAREVEVRLGARDRVLLGTVHDGDTRRSPPSAAGAGVWLFEQGGAWRTLFARPDGSGRFTLGVPSGEWVGCAMAQGYAACLFTLGDELPAALDLALFRTRDVRLRLTDRNGLPLAGCVRLQDEARAPVLFGGPGRNQGSTARIEAGGEVLLTGLPLRPLTVVCFPTGALCQKEWPLDPRALSGAVLELAHDGLDLAVPRRRVELEVLERTGDGAADWLGEGRLLVKSSGRATHQISFLARKGACLLERDKRVGELFCDARGIPTNARTLVRDDDDWGPRARLPGFDGRRPLFPLDLVPGSYELELEAGEKSVTRSFEVPAKGVAPRVTLVLETH